MNTPINTNIQQILTSFDNFITIYENDEWLKSQAINADRIKNAFKLGNFIEKVMDNFQNKNCTVEFINTLNTWWKAKNRTLVYNENFYKSICDSLLIKFFETKNLNPKNLDIAIRIYTSLYPKTRLELVLSNLIKTSGSFEALFEFICANKSEIDLNNLKHDLILSDWTFQLETTGNIDQIKSAINSLLTIHKVESNLQTIFDVLLLNESTNASENKVKNLIMDIILEKMLDRSILSKNFWLTLFKIVDKTSIIKLCEKSQDFFSSFCNFLLYIGGIMEKEEGDNETKWISVENISLVPEVSYEDLLCFIKCFYEKSLLKPYIVNRLMEARNYADCTVWEQIILDCT